MPCYLCQLPINYELTRWNYRHRLAPTVHHIIGLAEGGDPTDPTNLAPAHRSCNCRDGAIKQIQARRQTCAVRASRRW